MSGVNRASDVPVILTCSVVMSQLSSYLCAATTVPMPGGEVLEDGFTGIPLSYQPVR